MNDNRQLTLGAHDLPGIIPVLISIGSLVLVLLQWHGHIKQRRLESLIHIYDVNRQLIFQGFNHPELFKILEGGHDVDSVLTRRYLQLWLNQLALIYEVHKNDMLNGELQVSLTREIKDFMALKNMQSHWKQQRTFYPRSFRQFVDRVIQSLD